VDSQVRGSGLGPLPRTGTEKVHAEVDGADGREGRLAGGNSLSGYPTLGWSKAGFAEGVVEQESFRPRVHPAAPPTRVPSQSS
jgi:hypothetical protein